MNAGRGRPLFAVRPGAAGDISLKQGERSNQHVAWSEPRGGTYLPTAVAYEGALYSVSETGILSRYDAKTGNVTYKTRIDPAATAFSASPWAYNGKVFFLSEEGQTFVVAAGETFQLLHVNTWTTWRWPRRRSSATGCCCGPNTGCIRFAAARRQSPDLP